MDRTGLRGKALAGIRTCAGSRLGAGADRGDDRQPTRLVHLAPAGLGVPIACSAARVRTAPARPEADRSRGGFFEKEGADAWFDRTCRAASRRERRAGVRRDGVRQGDRHPRRLFDSGVSYACVCEGKENLGVPVDLYLEVPTSTAAGSTSSSSPPWGRRAYAVPRRADARVRRRRQGRGDAQVQGNVIAPEEIIRKHGAELLRLWVAAEDYRDDIRLSKDSSTVDGGVPEDPQHDPLPPGEHRRLRPGRTKCRSTGWRRWTGTPRALRPAGVEGAQAYEEYEFHVLFHAVNNFCSVDMSSFYLNVLKDGCTAPPPETRRGAPRRLRSSKSLGTAVAHAPCCRSPPKRRGGTFPRTGEAESVFLSDLPSRWRSGGGGDRSPMERILALRSEVAQPLETARREKGDRQRTGRAGNDLRRALRGLFETHAAAIRHADRLGDRRGEVTAPGCTRARLPGAEVSVEKAPWGKCERC